MADDFLSGVQIGANIGNMRAMRLERMMQLKAQEARQAMDERRIAAEVQMIAAHRDLYAAQAKERMNAEADLTGFQKMVTYDTEVLGTPEEEAIGKHLPSLAAANPIVGKHVADTLKSMKEAAIVGQPRPLTPEGQAATQALTQQRATAADLNRERTRQVAAGKSVGDLPTSIDESDAQTRLENELDQAKAGGDPTLIAQAQRKLKNLKAAFDRAHPVPKQNALLRVLQSGITAIDRQLHSPMASVLMDDEEKARLLEERKSLEDEIKGMGADVSDSVTPSSSTKSDNDPLGLFK